MNRREALTTLAVIPALPALNMLPQTDSNSELTEEYLKVVIYLPPTQQYLNLDIVQEAIRQPICSLSLVQIPHKGNPISAWRLSFSTPRIQRRATQIKQIVKACPTALSFHFS